MPGTSRNFSFLGQSINNLAMVAAGRKLLCWRFTTQVALFICTLRGVSGQLCTRPIDLILLPDSSLSIQDDGGSDNWLGTLRFLDSLASRFDISSEVVRVAIATYSSMVQETDVFYLGYTDTHRTLRQHIYGLDFIAGNTNTSGAMRFTYNRILNSNNGNRPFVTDVVVVITDGLSNVERERTFEESARLRYGGARVFTVGVTPYVIEEELQEIASDPYGFFGFRASDVQSLDRIVSELASHICSTSTPRTTPCTHDALDIALILDESGSITDKNPEGTSDLHNWNIMKQFAVAFLDSLNIGPQAMQIATITFSTKAKIAFYLNDMMDKASTLEAVSNLDYHSGGTNTSGALRMARREIFHPGRGDRASVPNVAIVVTDGESTVDDNQTQPEAAKLKQAGTHIFAVGVTDAIEIAELNGIASSPVEDNVLLSVTIDRVADLTSRLVFGICSLPNKTNADQPRTSCPAHQRLVWTKHHDHILMGHNDRRLQSVDTVELCQNYCLMDTKCRSVDYAKSMKECTISSYSRHQKPADFIPSDSFDYYEWACVSR